jgi:hypothetical protein
VGGTAHGGDRRTLATRLMFANSRSRRIENGEGGFKRGDFGAGVSEALIDRADEVLSDV